MTNTCNSCLRDWTQQPKAGCERADEHTNKFDLDPDGVTAAITAYHDGVGLASGIEAYLETTGLAPLDPIAEDVLAECRREAVRSLEQNDVPHWSPADVAADIVRHLGVFYEIDSPEAGPLERVTEADHLYEKCDGCHFFVEPNIDPEPGYAEFVHLDRGDEADELMQCNNPRPSGRRANLLTWKTYGPLLMRERFTS